MRTLTILLMLTVLSALSNAQNIFSALQLNQTRDYKTVSPKKIVETNTYYSSSGMQTDKNIKTYDQTGMLLLEERYDETGTLKAKLTYTNDSINRLKLTRTFERWTNLGYTKETAFYSYDSTRSLIRSTDKDASGRTMRLAEIVCNDRGLPIELSLFDGHGNSFGKETATYLYDRNRVVTAVVSTDGKIISTDTIKISFTTGSLFPNEKEIYNSHGDLVNWTRKNLNKTETIFEEEYTYDTLGNCTENKIYKVIVKGNGKRKRKIDRIFRKQYTY